mgnify:CR=1 FL=1
MPRLGDAHRCVHAGVTVHFETVAGSEPGRRPRAWLSHARRRSRCRRSGDGEPRTIPIMPDTLAEGAETVKLLLTSPAQVARCWVARQATLTIRTTTRPARSVRAPDVYGRLSPRRHHRRAQIAVTRTGSTASSVTVGFHTSDGTATAGQDYAATADADLRRGRDHEVRGRSDLSRRAGRGRRDHPAHAVNPTAPATLGAQRPRSRPFRDAQMGLQFNAPGVHGQRRGRRRRRSAWCGRGR